MTDSPDSPYGIAALWAQSDALIKAVAISLLLMSIVSWFVIVTRAWRAVKLRRASRAVAAFWHTHSFAEGMALLDQHGSDNPFRHLALEGQAAVDHHQTNKEDLHGQLSLAEWLTESLRGAIDESAERMGAGLTFLAEIKQLPWLWPNPGLPGDAGPRCPCMPRALAGIGSGLAPATRTVAVKAGAPRR